MKKITVQTKISAPIEKVWDYWNNPVHITKWAFASDDWECPHAEVDLKEGGEMLTRMSAKDGTSSFDLTAVYTKVIPLEQVDYTMGDNRTVSTKFEKVGEDVVVTEEFEMESENTEELQRNGWQVILDNFKKSVEGNL
ncbi:MAG: SRPBCC domain-containing protein [Patescibacteria group bacterium]